MRGLARLIRRWRRKNLGEALAEDKKGEISILNRYARSVLQRGGASASQAFSIGGAFSRRQINLAYPGQGLRGARHGEAHPDKKTTDL